MATKSYKDFETVLQINPDGLVRKKPRRTSVQSTLGCLNCKRKKIKCDETKSRCNNCVKSHLECAWPVVNAFDAQHRELSKSKTREIFSSTEIKAQHTCSPLLCPKPTKRSDHSDSAEGCKNVPQHGDTCVQLITKCHIGRKPESAGSDSCWPTVLHQTDRYQSKSDNCKVGEPVQQDLEEELASLQAPADEAAFQLVLRNVSTSREPCVDSLFLSQFVEGFLPTMAQVHFHDKSKLSQLVLTAAKSSNLLREIFIACGASIIAFNNSSFRNVAHERYIKAINSYLTELKLGAVKGEEDWLFVAVQVLQILCLRDAFAESNATRCAAHFGAACKIISNRILSSDSLTVVRPVSPLEKVMIENFIFNYSITIFFCDHVQLEDLVPDPFAFFTLSRNKLIDIFHDEKDQYGYKSILAFQIAAKSSWSCRLKLPLDSSGVLLNVELLQLAESELHCFSDAPILSLPHNTQITISIAKVVLKTSIILLRKIVDPINECAANFQDIVKSIRNDISQPYSKDAIFPIWALMIAASASLDLTDRTVFRTRLENLLSVSKSKIIAHVLCHLDGLWELYDNDEPFELLFDTTVLDQVCNQAPPTE